MTDVRALCAAMDAEYVRVFRPGPARDVCTIEVRGGCIVGPESDVPGAASTAPAPDESFEGAPDMRIVPLEVNPRRNGGA